MRTKERGRKARKSNINDAQKGNDRQDAAVAHIFCLRTIGTGAISGTPPINQSDGIKAQDEGSTLPRW
jgi:hypothetical protein